MSKDFRPDLMARAAMTRIANADPERVQDLAPAMGDYGKTLSKAELVIVVGYLAKATIRAQEASHCSSHGATACGICT